jgi:NAD(P)H-nitrite reductase large subunit
VSRRYVVVGSGVAGVAGAEAIRMADADGSVTLFNGEPFPFYYRAALSFCVRGALDEERLRARPVDWADRWRIRTVDAGVDRIDVDARRVVADDGSVLPYDRLLVATGAEPITPPWPGADLPGIVTYRSLASLRRMVETIRTSGAKKGVVVGGGILGVELAENFTNLGLAVTMLVREERILELLLDERGGKIVADRMAKAGIRIRTGVEADRFEGEATTGVKRVILADGSSVETDIVGVAVGVRPSAPPLVGAPVDTRRGVMVDDDLSVRGVADVWAAGDCAVRSVGDGPIPCRTWLTAGGMGKTAGTNMARDEKTPYRPPVFFNASHAYDLPYAVVGDYRANEASGARRIVVEERPDSYRMIVLREGRVAGGVCLGDIRPAWQIMTAIENGGATADETTLTMGAPGGFVRGLPPLAHRLF